MLLGIEVLKALFPNFRKYRDQKNSQNQVSMNHACLRFIAIQPVSVKNRPDGKQNQELKSD